LYIANLQTAFLGWRYSSIKQFSRGDFGGKQHAQTGEPSYPLCSTGFAFGVQKLTHLHHNSSFTSDLLSFMNNARHPV
jgi:hypothetical protein